MLPDGRRARDPREGLDDRVHPDADSGVDGNRFRLLDGDAGQHQLLHFPRAKNRIHGSELHTVVDAQHLGWIVDPHGAYGAPVPIQNLDDVGEVVFVRRIVRFNPVDARPEIGGLETINPGVDFAHL